MNADLKVGAVGFDVFLSPHVGPDGQVNVALDPQPALLALLLSAKTSVLVNVYSFTLPAVANALLALHARGVALRVVQDATEYGESGSQGPVLFAAGVDIRTWGSEWQLAHEKVAVVDGKAVWSGSWNWTNQAEKTNKEIATLVTGVKVQTIMAPFVTAQIEATYAAGRVPGT